MTIHRALGSIRSGASTARIAAATVVVLAACSGASSGASSASGTPKFVDETAASGVSHRYTGDFPYFVGGGVAAFDCNGDGKPELYAAGGASPAALYRNDSAVGGALRFTPLPSPVTDLTAVTGAYPLDVDSDGITDLVVLRNGAGNVLLRGLGDCRFEAANDRFSLAPGKDWTVGFSATWEGRNALPTLAFGNYLVPGRNDQCGASTLVRPAPSGTSYAAPVPLSPGYCALSALFADWSRTGQRDLRLANDRHYYVDGSEQLWKVGGADAPRLYTAADGWKPLQIWGMGIASSVLEGDSKPSVYLTSQGDNKLQSLDDGATGPAFHDVALKRGVTAQRPYTGGDVLPSTAWHPQFEDVNNDGYADLFVTKGNVSAQPDLAQRDPNNLLLGRSDGTFAEAGVEAGIADLGVQSRGAAVVDLNLDGLPDLVVVHREADLSVYRNVGAGDAAKPAPMGHWLGIRLRQPAPNTDAVGAWLDVRVDGRTQSRELTVGGGHASGQLGWTHVGLGPATSAEVRAQWPDGEVGPWMTVPADQFVTVERGTTTAVPFAVPAGT